MPAGLAGGRRARRRGGHPGGAQSRPSTRRGTRPSPTPGSSRATWPVEYGGLDVSPAVARAIDAVLRALQPRPAQPARASTWRRRRCSPTAPRSSGSASCRRSCATRSGGASSSASRAPGPTWRRSPREPSATATSGCSPARRCGPRGPTCRTSACASPAPTPTCRSARASPTSSSTCTRRGSRSGPLRHITGEIDFNEVFLDACARARRASGSATSATAGGSPTPRSRASGRWCRAPARVASTASAAPGATASCGRPRRAGAWDDPRHPPAAHGRCGARSRSAAGPTSGSGPA